MLLQPNKYGFNWSVRVQGKARLADVEIGWQLADSDPVYSSEGSVIYSAEHIQTRLYRRSLSLDTHSVFLGPSYLLVDYYTDDAPRAGRLLQQSEVIALVYQNLGIEAMAEGRLEESFWLLRAALQHDPANPDLYNAMAVLHRRAGDTVTAENLYRFSLDEFGDRLIILRNYRRLLVAQERSEEARDRAWTASDQGRYREKLAARGER